MTTQIKSVSHTHSWLDPLAISMSVLCAIHCMITPVLAAVLPVVATTLWAHKDFHLWMLLLVVPMALLSLLLGCRKHKCRLVLSLGLIGIGIITSIAVYESFAHTHHCAHSVHQDAGGHFGAITWINLLGAAFLTAAHTRNFLLCRKAHCCH